MKYEIVIGVEIHAQLKTNSKMFSSSSTSFGSEQNTQANLIDLAMPGTLPVVNKKAVELACLFGLAVDAKINKYNVFARKNYFYPDLPKGYQTSQMDLPIVQNGFVNIFLKDNEVKKIGITRAHLEEDAGKSIHDLFHNYTAIDLNRAGNVLLEIVSEPDMRSKEEALAYIKTIYSLVRYLDICDGNMNEGSFRCDCNISIRPFGQKEFGTRTELKNINSFKFIEKAIEGEIERQIDLIESGQKVIQETRLYDSVKNSTRSMRDKEEANDYRYFPCPDLTPIKITEEFLSEIQTQLPELQHSKKERFIKEYSLNDYDAQLLVNDKKVADYFEEVFQVSKDAKLSANWILGDLNAIFNKHNVNIDNNPISSLNLGTLILRIKDGTISGKIAKQIFEKLLDSNNKVDDIINKSGLKQVNDNVLILEIIDKMLNENATQVNNYKQETDDNKKKKMLNYLVGQLMKFSKGQANPQQANELLKKALEK